VESTQRRPRGHRRTLDADTADFSPRFVVGLLGPLLSDPEIRFVKGAFLRPLQLAGSLLPGQGGRVTELVARPLLNRYAPHLAGFDQPLAGEMAQVDIGTRQNRHQPLRDLSAMSYAVMVAAATRLGDAGLAPAPAPGPLALPPLPGETAVELRQVTVTERPPLDSLARLPGSGQARERGQLTVTE